MNCELLSKVLDYYEGRKPYDFYRLHDMEQRANEAFDAWQEIAEEIRAALAIEAGTGETPQSASTAKPRKRGAKRNAQKAPQ